MNHSKESYLLYLEEEIRNTKILLSKLNNHDTITHYIQELDQIEENYLRLKSPKRQDPSLIIPTIVAPTVNVPPPRPITAPPAIPLTSIPTELTIPETTFTLEELQTNYRGLNGQPAYVALYGIVFDVSNIATWGGATHFGLLAGTDATPGARACGFHNPIDIMRKMPAVGYFERSPSDTLGVSGPTGPLGVTGPLGATGPSSVTINPIPDVTIPNRFFTLQALENKYNGKNNNPAYVAMNGIVFDVTNSRTSHNSKHFGLCSMEDLNGAILPRIVGKVKEIEWEV